MPSLPGFFSDTFEELGETVKQSGQQLVKLPVDLLKTGGQQLKGQPGKAGDAAAQDSGIESVSAGAKPTLQPKKNDQQWTPQQQLEVKKREDNQRSMLRYKQILDELQRYRQQKAQETPAYVAGRPGAAKNKQEEIELWQKQQKEAEEKKKQGAIRLPGQQGGTQGSGERAKFVAG